MDCGGAQTTAGLPKQFNTPGAIGVLGNASPFTLYGHVHCSPVGLTPEEAQAKADEQLILGEQRAAEEVFWTGIMQNAPALEQNGEDITVSGSSYAETIGQLEKWIGDVYGSLGVIHMTRKAAIVGLSLNVLETSGGRLLTRLGTPVAAGAGYRGNSPGMGVPPPAHSTWIFATPALIGYRSEIFHPSVVSGDLLNRGTNELFAVSERTYLIGYEPCGTVAALTPLA